LECELNLSRFKEDTEGLIYKLNSAQEDSLHFL